MATPRKHTSAAHRQAAYMQRQKMARLQQAASRGLPALPAIANLPGTSRWKAALDSARRLLETTAQEIEDYREDRSEAWQESERAERLNETATALREVIDSLDEVEIG